MLFARNHKKQNIFFVKLKLLLKKGDFLAKKLMIRVSVKFKVNSKKNLKVSAIRCKKIELPGISSNVSLN